MNTISLFFLYIVSLSYFSFGQQTIISAEILIKHMNHILKTILKDKDHTVSYRFPGILSHQLFNTITVFIKH
ncbi:hypothetical protein [Psychroserpens algicola]|uniref:Secreted protein n=1 Tax=Psychroserpens algicola TaxID=1719034 RepID=A0ABT0H746_9FLAO|nr:hypothetical protein [Psychroserpens algicola]MCK8480196.1 hypothetical protein [Psychroserpens algicola]